MKFDRDYRFARGRLLINRDDGYVWIKATDLPHPQTIWKRKRKGGRIGANGGRFEGGTNYSLRFPFRAGTIEFCARERNRATVSHSLWGFLPFFFSFFLFFFSLFLHTHSPRRTAYKRTPPSVQVYVGPRCTLSGVKRENKRKREGEAGKQN